MDPNRTNAVTEEQFNEHIHEIEIPPQFADIKNNKKIFQMMDKGGDGSISL
jgi:Ca2+-binding EF-hand superfamily protein